MPTRVNYTQNKNLLHISLRYRKRKRRDLINMLAADR